MRQNEIPPASRQLNSTEAKQDLLGVTSSTRVWLLALVVVMLAPIGY